MRRAKHSDGSSIFEKYDYLTPPQIAGFFSRLSAKKTYSRDQPGDEEELERHELETEKVIEEMKSEVTKTFALQHPIMYEKYNICEIVCQSKLSKFSIPTLQKICAALEKDVASMSSKRKQPYVEIIEGVVARCGCTCKTWTVDQTVKNRAVAYKTFSKFRKCLTVVNNIFDTSMILIAASVAIWSLLLQSEV